jgi:hypothetical protein
VRQLRELAPQEVRHGAHFLGRVGAHHARGGAPARDAHRAHRRGHEQREDRDGHEQLDEGEA